MSSADFLNAWNVASPDVAELRRRLDALSDAERHELRAEIVRRLAADEIDPATALAILPFVGVEAAAPDLVRLLRSDAPLPARAAALVLLRRYTTDLDDERELPDPALLPELVETAVGLGVAVDFALQRGTPFESLALADPEDEDVDIDEIFDELLDAFCASPEALAVDDRAELRFWAGELVRLGIDYGHGSPTRWDRGDIDELLGETMPRKITLGSAEEAEPAVPAFRAFFRWASRVAPMESAARIDAALEEYAADFPAMMMDSRRFGLAKSFVAKGTAAGFDMSTEEGLHAFAEAYNRELGSAATVSRKKMDAAKKRKAKMAKLSRRKNRRRK